MPYRQRENYMSGVYIGERPDVTSCKVQSLIVCSTSISKKQECQFLGLTRYYHWFLLGFSFVIATLIDLL